MDQPDPYFSLGDVNAHLEALFLITAADEGAMSTRLEDQLDIVLEQPDQLRSVLRYLAAYGAILCRQAQRRNPGDPAPTVREFMSELGTIVANAVPRPE